MQRELQDYLTLAEQAGEDGEPVSAESYIAFTRGKERRIAQLTSELSAATDKTPAGQIPLLPADLDQRVEELWPTLPVSTRREIIKVCWERIVVHPSSIEGSRKDPSRRVELIPRAELAQAA